MSQSGLDEATSQEARGISRPVVAGMAAAAGIAVANLYYPQPLLPQMAHDLHASPSAIASVVTSSQVGYGLGILFIVPLGDALERRRLIVVMLLLTAAAMAAAALSTSTAWILAASLVVGFTTITPQLLVPFAAHLALPQERGRVVGIVMSGLLVGILLARTASGLLADPLGWRAVYWFGAAMMVALAVGLRWMLPRGDAVNPHINYRDLLWSLRDLVRSEPVLRYSSLLGAMSFAAFSGFWTVLPFLLAGPPFHYGTGVIGLFGLIGLTGVTVAPIAGRLSDTGRGNWSIGTGFVAILLSMAVLQGGNTVAIVIAGIVLLDLGSTANHISNQARVYSVRPEARNRMNTVYMVTYFVGGSLGSLFGAWGWTYAGWRGFCAVAAGFAIVGLVIFLRSLRAIHPPHPSH